VSDDVAVPLGAFGIIRRFGWGLGDQLLSSVTNFVLGLVVARSVGPQDLGAFSIAFATYTLSLGAPRGGGRPTCGSVQFGPRRPLAGRVRTAAGTALTIGSVIGLGCVAAALLFGQSLRITFLILGSRCRPCSCRTRGGTPVRRQGKRCVPQRPHVGRVDVRDVRPGRACRASPSGGSRPPGHVAVPSPRSWGSSRSGSRRAAPQGLSGDSVRRGTSLLDSSPEFALSSGTSSLIVFGIGSLAGLAQVGRCGPARSHSAH
jgi:hypothetical protein